jgi:hypothetical protein
MMMMKPVFTRYFTFVKVNPSRKDYDALEKVAKKIQAFLGYKVMRSGDREYLAGFIVLYNQRAFTGQIYAHLPNFLVKPMDGPMDWDAVERTYDRVFGTHPFSDIRKKLFS